MECMGIGVIQREWNFSVSLCTVWYEITRNLAIADKPRDAFVKMKRRG